MKWLNYIKTLIKLYKKRYFKINKSKKLFYIYFLFLYN